MTDQLVEAIRTASRKLAQAWGLHSSNQILDALPLSSVYAVIEIGRNPGLTSKDLVRELGLEKSTISRLVRSLRASRLVKDGAAGVDARQKPLELTTKGEALFGRLNELGNSQVRQALNGRSRQTWLSVLAVLEDYGSALAGEIPPEVVIETGYRPGLIGRLSELMTSHMAKTEGFGLSFEARISADMAEFMPRAGNPDCRTWVALVGNEVVGGVSIDGEDIGKGTAHLRWFVVAPEMRGRGVGYLLLQAALSFVDERDFKETRLWTTKELKAAGRLYEALGFHIEEEFRGDQWGSSTTELVYVRPGPGLGR